MHTCIYTQIHVISIKAVVVQIILFIFKQKFSNVVADILCIALGSAKNKSFVLNIFK